MAWTQTLVLWKLNAAPPCSGPLIANVTCCSLATVFFPLCLARNAWEAVSWHIHGEILRSGADEDAPFQITEGQEHPEWFRADVFLKTDDWTSHLILWPWLAAVRPGASKYVVEGWTCSSDLILHYQPSQLSAERLPSTEQWLKASGHRLRGPGEEAPLICNSEMQRRSGERYSVSSLCLHIWFSLWQTQHSGRLMEPGLSSSEFDLYNKITPTQNVHKMYILCRSLQGVRDLQSVSISWVQRTIILVDRWNVSHQF